MLLVKCFMKNIIFIFLMYFAGILAFFGSNILLTFMHWLTIAVGLVSFIVFISKYRWSHVTFFIFLFAIITPIYASIQSLNIFDQPLYMGMASLRYGLFILFGYFLILIKYDYRLLLRQINTINLFVAVFSIVAILILGISPSAIRAFEVSNDVLNVGASTSGETVGVGGVDIRGIRFSACSNMMLISLVFYQLASLKVGGKRNWIPLLTLVTYILFVHKGRQPVAIMAVVYVLYFLKMKGLSPKRVTMLILPILCFLFLIGLDETILFRFTTILDGEKSADFSTLARIWEVEQIWPYIINHPFMGVGNLSAHFGRGGFQTLFGPQFYLSDIGIIGTLARGGLLFVIIYVCLYFALWHKLRFIHDSDCRLFMNYMLISYAILGVFLFNDILFADGSVQFALLFYPLFRQKKSNIYISHIERNGLRKYQFI